MYFAALMVASFRSNPSFSANSFAKTESAKLFSSTPAGAFFAISANFAAGVSDPVAPFSHSSTV